MLINKRYRPGGKGIVLDTLIVFSIVQLIQVALDLPTFCPGQLHGIRKDRLLIVTPCIVRDGVADENVTLPKSVRPRWTGKAQKILSSLKSCMPVNQSFFERIHYFRLKTAGSEKLFKLSPLNVLQGRGYPCKIQKLTFIMRDAGSKIPNANAKKTFEGESYHEKQFCYGA